VPAKPALRWRERPRLPVLLAAALLAPACGDHGGGRGSPTEGGAAEAGADGAGGDAAADASAAIGEAGSPEAAAAPPDAAPPDAPVWPDGPVAAPWVIASVRSPVPPDGGAEDADRADSAGDAGDAGDDGGGAGAPPLGAAAAAGAVLALRAAGRGVDISAGEDEFLFVHQVLRGDATVTARVRALEGCPRGRVTFGVMVRETLATDARYLMSAVIGARGAAVQSRSFVYAQTLRLDATVPLPLWLRVERRGDGLRAGHSQDGRTWVEAEKILGSLSEEIYAGLVASSHEAGRPCAALFEGVAIAALPGAADAGAAPDAAGD
jgi:hypothetical protein